MLNPAYKLEVAGQEGIDMRELRKCHRTIREPFVYGVRPRFVPCKTMLVIRYKTATGCR